jgi:hypothetical protein
MGRNARVSPGPMSVNPPVREPQKGTTGEKQLASGFRGRKNAPSPASGVRSAQSEPPPPSSKVAIPPPARIPYDSEAGLTQVGAPDPSLLALSRREEEAALAPSLERRPRRAVWFGLGVLVGGILVWAATNDVSADVYRARVWAASTLRSVRGHAGEAAAPATSATVASAPAVIPTVDVTQLPKASDEQVQPPTGAPAATLPAPGAPALPHAPGPR